MKHRSATIAPGLASVLLTLPLVGCDDGRPARYQVTGEVTYNGEPLPRGSIAFSPRDPDQGVGCFGEIEDGYYRMTTFDTGDGAVPGLYDVSITAIEVTPTNPLDDIELSPTPEAAVARDMRDARHLIPAKYNNPASSGLSAEVLAESNEIDFSLTD